MDLYNLVVSAKLSKGGGGDEPVLIDKAITSNGTYNASSDSADGYKKVVVNVPSVTPTGNINITSTAQTDVSAYATAQVVDADLVASNIKKDVDILGVVGTYEGGGGGGGIGTLLHTESLGLIQYSSTSEGDLSKSITVSGVNDYDLLILMIVADNKNNSHHLGTVSLVMNTTNGTYYPDYEGNKTTSNTSTNRINYMIRANGDIASKYSSYGIFPANSNTISAGTVTFNLWAKYNTGNTSTIDDTYTAKVYGLHLYELL